MKKYNRDGIGVAYLTFFIGLGAYIGSYSTNLQSFFITLGVFSIFGIGGSMFILKNISLTKPTSQSTADGSRK